MPRTFPVSTRSKRRRSRRSAWRGGLADQTVVKNFEDVRAYRAFERILVGSSDRACARHRLASLLWRLRRASAIETGLFEMHRRTSARTPAGPLPRPRSTGDAPNSTQANGSKSNAIAQCFLRLSHLDPTLLDRVGSYEARLWRQAAQIIWTLDAMRRPPPAPTRRPFRNPVIFSYWDAERCRD
jgi:hypothetical protein